jgi:hypothetical protein
MRMQRLRQLLVNHRKRGELGGGCDALIADDGENLRSAALPLEWNGAGLDQRHSLHRSRRAV